MIYGKQRRVLRRRWQTPRNYPYATVFRQTPPPGLPLPSPGCVAGSHSSAAKTDWSPDPAHRRTRHRLQWKKSCTKQPMAGAENCPNPPRQKNPEFPFPLFSGNGNSGKIGSGHLTPKRAKPKQARSQQPKCGGFRYCARL